jgi:Uncharacterized protein conserved in bacteria
MTKFVVLLRGVMPIGKNRVPMAQLREVLSQDNVFQGVQTWIQSGNVVLETLLSPKEVAVRVNELIKEHIGPDITIIVKTPQELQKVLDENPFAADYDIKRVFLRFSMICRTRNG